MTTKTKQPELSTVDEFYYSHDTDCFMYDVPGTTRVVSASNRLYGQIVEIVRDWEQETVNRATLYRRPQMHRVERNAGAHVGGG